MKALKYLKYSLPYYWYTGEKKIAMGAGTIGLVLSTLFLIVMVGTSAVSLLFVLIFDKLMLTALIFYLFFIRNIVPIDMITDAIDNLFIENFIYISIAMIVNRIVVNIVAEKLFGYKLESDREDENFGFESSK